MAARPKKQNSPQTTEAPQATQSAGYLVVARRYRPQRFDELVGQEHIVNVLKNAIKTGRVGHAYLFTGARGVGKTSTARIFAKALNCVNGPTTEPCNRCDICRSISLGEDIDVQEIDGASNRGIEEIRQLRQNVVVRPSRARFKIYIIDEVHMLTKEAFNALLKTLEEPPEHVKFIFCTTEPNKVPITILSRCQRFDFLGIDANTITSRLQQILEAEGRKAEPGVLELLAQRAAGSMRDAQSLLEQLLAFADKEIKLQDVFDLLGMARSDVLAALTGAAADGDAGEVLGIFHRALSEGADPTLFVEQLLTFFRDCLVAEVQAPQTLFLAAQVDEAERVRAIATKWGLHRLLAAMQILDHTLGRMRAVTYDRVLAELALVRIARLGELAHLGELLEMVKFGQGDFTLSGATNLPTTRQARPSLVSPPGSKSLSGNDQKAVTLGTVQPSGTSQPVNVESSKQAIADAKEKLRTERQKAFGRASGHSESSHSGGQRLPLTRANAAAIWKQVYESVGGLAGDHAKAYHSLNVLDNTRLVVAFKKIQVFSKDFCSRPGVQEKFVNALRAIVGPEASLEFTISDDGGEAESTPEPSASGERLLFEVLQEPMIRKTVEIFGARPVAVFPPSKQSAEMRTESPVKSEDLDSSEEPDDESSLDGEG